MPAAVEAPPEPRLFVAGDDGVEEAGTAPAVDTTDGVLAEVAATLAAPAVPATTGTDTLTGGRGRRSWIIGGIGAAIAALAVTAVAIALPQAQDEDARRRMPLASVPEPTTTTTAPEPRPTIAAEVDACPSLTAGVVPGHLVVTDLLASSNRDGRYVGVLTGESRPRDMTKLAPFAFVAVLGDPPPPPEASVPTTTPTRPPVEHVIDAAGTTQLWVRWNGTALETALRRRTVGGRWVTEPAPDLRVEMNPGRIIRWYWPGLVPGMPFATVAAGSGQCQAAGLDPATLQPLPGIAAVR